MKDYYSLAEVAKLLDVQIDEIEEDIFKGKIIPSRNMKRPVDANLSTEEELPPDEDNYVFTETRFIKRNISFSGNVDIYGLTGCTPDRKIELLPDGLESILSDKPRPILFCKQELQRMQVRLREPYSFRVDELITPVGLLETQLTPYEVFPAFPSLFQLPYHVHRIDSFSVLRSSLYPNSYNTFFVES